MLRLSFDIFCPGPPWRPVWFYRSCFRAFSVPRVQLGIFNHSFLMLISKTLLAVDHYYGAHLAAGSIACLDYFISKTSHFTCKIRISAPFRFSFQFLFVIGDFPLVLNSFNNPTFSPYISSPTTIVDMIYKNPLHFSFHNSLARYYTCDIGLSCH